MDASSVDRPDLARQFLRAGVVDVPPHAYFVVSAIFHYLGPSFAVLLFARVEPLGVAWIRILVAAGIFLGWRRRNVLVVLSSARGSVVALGLVFAAMNSVFYLALERLALGTVAAIEFSPVVALAAIGLRSRRNVAALALAAAGVVLLADVSLEGEPIGFALAAANAGFFALYVIIGHRLARRGAGPGIDGLAAAMVIAALAAAPIGAAVALPELSDPLVLGGGIGVAVTSSVIPYVTDQLAMSRLKRSTYALLLSLLPATATIIGLVVLAQIPTAEELTGVALVMAAVAIHRQRGAR